MEWNSELTTPTEQPVSDDLYPISYNGGGCARLGDHFIVSECQGGG